LLRVLDHELRTPLAASLLQLDAAEAAIGGPGPPEQAKAAVATAARQLRALSTIIARAIQLETDRRVALCPQRVDLREVVTDFMERVRATRSAWWSRIELRATRALVGRWDPAAFEQILENLLSNALKYGKDAPVRVTIAPARGGARLQVRDAGIGIEPAHRERIFGRFARAPSARGIAGMGIGLWVVRHLIAAHGGRVDVRSRPGQWTVLDVWLPELAP
jgi:signal transduction histidine kinase